MSDHAAASEHDPVSREQEKYVLLATILSSSLAFIDYSALNVALPSIQHELDIEGKGLLWIVNAYGLFLSALLLVGGALGDLRGRKKILILGIFTFCLASAGCGLAPDATILIVFRAIQGIGAAMMVPGSLSIISAVIQKKRRGRAFGTWSMFSALTTVIGPVLGGWLAGQGWWRAIFFINIPLGILAAWILWKKVPETANPDAKAIDVKGATMATLGLAGVTYAFIEAPERGWDSTWVLASLVLGLAGLALFIRQEMVCPHPMVPPSLFKNRVFNGANVLTMLVYAALSATMFFLPLNLVQVQGYSEQAAGLAILPFALCIAATSRWAGNLTDRTGPGTLLTIGPILTGIAYIWMSIIGVTNGPEDYFRSFLGPMLLMGAGMGITVAPLTTTVMTAAEESMAGAASGVNNAVSRTAGVLAIAILGALALVYFEEQLLSSPEALPLNRTAREALRNAAGSLAAATVPDAVPGNLQKSLQEGIKHSFTDTFGLIMYLSATMAFISSIVARITISKK
ncbi:MAG: MFS transporter [Cyclobacteriaceae bacterium]